MEEVQNRSEDMDVEDENTQAGMLASDVLGIYVMTKTWYVSSLCVPSLCSFCQAVDADASEAESQLPEDTEDVLFAAEETDGSDEELGAHKAPATPASSMTGRAELDHLDSFDRPAEEDPA